MINVICRIPSDFSFSRSLVTILLICCVMQAKSQSTGLLYGTAFYPEYMPYNRIDKDISMMTDANLNLVRLGESSWALFEPKDGVFNFKWMDSVIDKMNAVGIKVLIGTPTYSIPAWLAKKYPDILVKNKWGGQFVFGGRCSHDITNIHFLFYAQRIVTKMVQHYSKYPGVIGFQLDNETKTNFLGSTSYYNGLKKEVQSKFGMVQKLNKAWGLNYWSQTIYNWNELPSVNGTVFGGYKLDLERYNQKTISNYLQSLASIVEKYKRADQFITHNFDLLDGGPNPNVKHDQVVPFLDYVGTDIYHNWQNDFTGAEISCGGDYARSLKHQGYFVIETNAQTTTINENGQQPPFPGQLRLAYFAHIASGAKMVEYWHWHSTHSGAEIYWKGILSQDLAPNRIYDEIAKIGEENKHISDELKDIVIKNKVAIFYSHDSYFGIQNEPFSKNINYQTNFAAIHKYLYELNIGTDIITSVNNLDSYQTVIVPMLYISNDLLLKQLITFANKGGHLIFTAKSGYEDENAFVRINKQPGIVSDAISSYYQEFTNLKQMIPLKSTVLPDTAIYIANEWAEMLIPNGAEILLSYEDEFLKPYAAVTSRSYGKGSITYMGTFLNSKGFKAVYQYLAKKYTWDSFLKGDDVLPVVIKHAINNRGEVLHFLLNFSNQTKQFKYHYACGTSLLSQRKIYEAQTVTIEPWGVEIIKEIKE